MEALIGASRTGHDRLQRAAGKLQTALLCAVDLGLAAILFMAPLMMGGRHPVGHLVYVALACLVATAWFAHQALAGRGAWTLSGAELPMLGGILLLVAQFVPWPAGLVSRLSPITSELLPLWTSASEGGLRLGQWHWLSLTPEATRCNLVMFVAYALLFFVVLQRIREIGDVERLLRWIALAAVGMATLGLAQFLLGNGKFLWVYQHPFRDTHGAVKGAFANPNHFAHFLALGLPPLLWWLHRWYPSRRDRTPDTRGGRAPRTDRTDRRLGRAGVGVPFSPSRSAGDRRARPLAPFALAVGLGVVSFAGLLSFSRGGVIIIFLAAAVCAGFFSWRGLLGKKAIAGLAAIGLFVAAALLVYGYTPLAGEIQSLTGGSMDDIDVQGARRKLWAADFEALRRAPWFGTGSGSHAEVYKSFYPDHAGVEYTHAESGYVHILTETGVVGLLLATSGVLLCGWWCVSAVRRCGDPRMDACSGAVVAALTVSAVHSVWDFVWFIPACMTLTIVLAACACRLRQFAAAGKDAEPLEAPTTTAHAFADAGAPAVISLPRWVGGVAAVAVGLVSLGMVGTMIGPALAAPAWDRYRVASKGLEPDQEPNRREESVASMIDLLEQTLAQYAKHPRANVHLAVLYLVQFEIEQRASENAIPLVHIRSVAGASKFPSQQALDRWLAAAVGPRRKYLDKATDHIRRGLQICPLIGKGYVHLAQLTFLHGFNGEQEAVLVQQALRVRPYDGAVLFAAGTDAAMAGDIARAMQFWKRAFHQDPTFRARLIDLLAPNLSAAVFLQEFNPDLDALRKIYWLYRDLGRDGEAMLVGPPYARQLETAAAAAGRSAAGQFWAEAWQVHRFLGDNPAAIGSLRRAADAAPDNYDYRRNLAAQLILIGEVDEAIEHLRWCRRRKPHDDNVRQLWTKAERQRWQSTAAARSTAQVAPESIR